MPFPPAQKQSQALSDRDRRQTKPSWKDLPFDQLLDLHSQLTFSEIGGRFRVSKQAVQGKITAMRCSAKRIERIKIAKSLFDRRQIVQTPVDDLDLNAATRNALKRAGIENLGDIASSSIEKLRRIGGLGKHGLDQIRLCMIDVGLDFRCPEPCSSTVSNPSVNQYPAA